MIASPRHSVLIHGLGWEGSGYPFSEILGKARPDGEDMETSATILRLALAYQFSSISIPRNLPILDK